MRKNSRHNNNRSNKFHFRTLALMFLIALVAVCVPATTHTEAKTADVYKVSASTKNINFATSKKLDLGKTYTFTFYKRSTDSLDNNGKFCDLMDKDGKHYWFRYKTNKATWKSSNPKVATVSSTGKVTTKKKGTTTITAKLYGKTYSYKVTVLRPISKSLLKFEEIPTAGNGFGGAGLAYKITNNNDYTVEFELWGDFYAMNPDKGYKYEWTGKYDYYMGMYVLNSGESAYITKATPVDSFYKFNGEQVAKYPMDYYSMMSETFEDELKMYKDIDGIDFETSEHEIVAARTYTKFKTRITDFKKSSRKSEIKNIKITLSADGKKLSVTNKGKNAITNLTLLAVGLNSKGKIDRVIGIHTDDFGTKTIKPGETYSMKVGGKGTNWQEFFGTNGKPHRIYIENADTWKIAY